MRFMIAVAQGVKYVRVGAAVGALVVGTVATVAAQSVNATPNEFRVGDRVALAVDGPLAFADTFVVRDGVIISLGHSIGDVSLKGVRRSDVQNYLMQQISKFVKDPTVRAVPLISVGVFGALVRPGYYSVPTDIVLNDLLTRAGGLTSNADVGKTEVQRQGKTFLNKKQTGSALATGKTLDDVQIVSGDQLVVSEKSGSGLQTLLQVGTLAIGLAGLAFTLARH
jgi:protein involved in polysaccharide export with SLBB domain